MFDRRQLNDRGRQPRHALHANRLTRHTFDSGDPSGHLRQPRLDCRVGPDPVVVVVTLQVATGVGEEHGVVFAPVVDGGSGQTAQSPTRLVDVRINSAEVEPVDRGVDERADPAMGEAEDTFEVASRREVVAGDEVVAVLSGVHVRPEQAEQRVVRRQLVRVTTASGPPALRWIHPKWRTSERCVEAALSASRRASGQSGSDGVHEPASQSIRTAVRRPSPPDASKLTTEPSDRSPGGTRIRRAPAGPT